MSRLDAIKDWEERARAASYDARALARQTGVCERQLRRHLAGLFGLPSKNWIDQLRAREGLRRLTSGEPVKSVAFQLGFKQVSHFCAFFKRVHGIRPSAYRFMPWEEEMSATDNKCPF